MAPRIVDPQNLVADFLREWHSESSVIAAHTSGSTGKPKTIELQKEDMRRSARATCQFFGINERSHLWLPLSVNYIAGKMMVVRALESGATLHVELPSLSPMSTLPQESVIDLIAVVPAQLDALLANQSLKSVRHIIVGGAPMSPEQEQAARGCLGTTVWATYGMTETCSHLALRNVSKGCDCYEALPGIEFTNDERGCLVAEAPGFSFSPVVTNDLVEIVSDRRFRWLGRIDNVIISGAIKLYPEDIERRLSPFMQGREFYIVGRPSQRWGQEAVMVVEGENIDKADILTISRENLPNYMVPKAVVTMARFERTSTGKVKRILPR